MSLTAEAIQSLVTGKHGDPFAVLGPHPSRDGSVTVRAFLPGAAEVAVVPDGGPVLAPPLKPVHRDGLWEGKLAKRPPAAYLLRNKDGPEHVTHVADPDPLPPALSGFHLH